MLQHYQDLFQQPGFYQSRPLWLDSRLARDIVQISRKGALPIYRFECSMSGVAVNAGEGLQDAGINMGFGASYQDASQAVARSIAEAYERKYAKQVDENKLVTATRKQLGRDAVDPHSLTLISSWERQRKMLPYVPYNDELPLAWYPCYKIDVGSLQRTLIPASLIVLQYSWTRPAQRIAPILSAGLASHVTYREAALNGLLEVLERDAFMRAWLLPGSSLRRIVPRPDDLAEARELVAFLKSLAFEITFVDLTCDTDVPVILTTMENHELPWDDAVVAGLGCHPDPAQALRKALLEAAVALENYISLDLEQEQIQLKIPATIAGLPAAAYFQRVRQALTTTGETKLDQLPNRDRRDTGKNLEQLIGLLTAQGRSLYLADLTPVDASGTAPLCLTRMLISDLQPMVYEADCWRLNPARLFSATSSPTAQDFARLNLLPHPFMIWG